MKHLVIHIIIFAADHRHCLRCEALRKCVMIIFHERIIVGLIFDFNFTRNPLITQELPSFLLELYKVSLLSIYINYPFLMQIMMWLSARDCSTASMNLCHG
jgi:type III secretory pathway component EscR